MKINSIKKGFILIFLSSAFLIHAESNIALDFYGIASKDAEKNMLSMTENLYFTQLKEMNISVTDKRTNTFSDLYFESPSFIFQEKSTESQAFYAVIKKLPDSKWECKIFLSNPSTNETKTSTKIYDSYYKIMMESKPVLNDIFSDLISGTSAPKKAETTSSSEFSLEMLSGTWTGESSLSKIVILRGGRGFVIFKNGASMNINAKILNDQDNKKYIVIQQTGNNNASYFPELDRKVALDLALNAEPITWTLYPDGNGNLTGTKNSFLQKNNEIIWGSSKVFWKKSL